MTSLTSPKHSLFVSCPPTLEPLLIEELKELGLPSVQLGYRGGFVHEWDWPAIYRINYASRLASRVLLPLLKFRCLNRQALYRHASEVDWSLYLKKGWTFAIDAHVHHQELRNSLFAAQVVKDAICDQMRHQFGERPSVQIQHPDVQIHLFIDQQTAILSFDTSGEALHKRGYRQESLEAPLRENLAAALLLLSRYTKEEIFLDPCCGSGTLLIEAALIASETPPGYLRKQWGFMRHPQYQGEEWLTVRHQIDQQRKPLETGVLFGIDQSKQAVRACQINLRAAGFSRQVEVRQADFREYQPSVAPTFILTNPPHGRRLGEEAYLKSLYRALGDFMKKKSAKPGRGYIFTGNLELAKEVGLAATRRHVLSNSGVDSRLLEFNLY